MGLDPNGEYDDGLTAPDWTAGLATGTAATGAEMVDAVEVPARFPRYPVSATTLGLDPNGEYDDGLTAPDCMAWLAAGTAATGAEMVDVVEAPARFPRYPVSATALGLDPNGEYDDGLADAVVAVAAGVVETEAAFAVGALGALEDPPRFPRYPVSATAFGFEPYGE